MRVFEELSASLPDLAENILESTFFNGLNPVIRVEVLCMRPVGLEEIMYTTQLIKDKQSAFQGDSIVLGHTIGLKATSPTPPTVKNLGPNRTTEPFATKTITSATRGATIPLLTQPPNLSTSQSHRKDVCFKRLTEAKFLTRNERVYVLNVMKSSP